MKNILAVEVSEYSRWATLNLLGDEDDDELERDPVIYLKSRAPFVIQAFVGLIVEIVLDFLAVRVMLPSVCASYSAHSSAYTLPSLARLAAAVRSRAEQPKQAALLSFVDFRR